MTRRLRVLLDENLPHTLRHHLREFSTFTAAYAGLAGLENGELLDAAERAGFDVLVTGDKMLHHEQNLAARRIAIVCLSANSWPVIEPHVANIALAISGAAPGSFTPVDCGVFSRLRRPT